MLFPCRPDRHVRVVRLADTDISMRMDSCAAGAMTFSLAFLDAPDGASLPTLLGALRDSAVANIGGTTIPMVLTVPGATPNPQSVRLRVDGRLADRRQVIEQVAFFVKGLRVYQATAIGGALSPDAADYFFTSIKVAP